MNVYKEINKLREYEISRMSDKLNEMGGAYEFEDDDRPTVVYYDRYGDVDKGYVKRVHVDRGGGIVLTLGDTWEINADDLIVGELTFVMDEII